MPALRHLTVPSLALAIAATACVGVTYASASRHGAKACVTSKGYLALRSAKGNCPRHTRKVTLGKQGAAGPPGKRGPAGPSNGYVATTRNTPVYPFGSTTVASLRLPAGSYSLIGAVDSSTNFTEPGSVIECELVSGDKSTVQYWANLPAAYVASGTTVPGQAGLSVPGSLTLPAAGTVALVCAGSGGNPAVGTLQAVKVAKLTASGDPDFQ
jgi:hypothetical protein